MYKNKYVMLLVIRTIFAAYIFSPGACTAMEEHQQAVEEQSEMLTGELTPNDVSPLLHRAWLSPGGQTALHISEEPSAAHAHLSRAVHTAAACPVVTMRDATPLSNESVTVSPGAALHVYGLSRVGQLRRLQDFISASAARNPNLVVVLVFQNSRLSHGDFGIEWDSWRRQLRQMGIYTTLEAFAIEENSLGTYFNKSRLVKLPETNFSTLRKISTHGNSSATFSRGNSDVYILKSTFRPLKLLEVSKHSTLEVSTKFFRNVTNKTTVWDGYDYLSWSTFEEWIGFPLKRAYVNPRAKVWNKDVIEHLVNNTAEFAFNYHYFTHQRYQLHDYTASVTQFPLCIIIHKAPTVPFSLLLLRPYSLVTWIALVVSLAVGSVGLCIAHRFAFTRSHTIYQNIHEHSQDEPICYNVSSTVDDRSLKMFPIMTLFKRGRRDRVNSWLNSKGTILPESLQGENVLQPVETAVTLSARNINPLSVHTHLKQSAEPSTKSELSKRLCVNCTFSTLKHLGRAVFDTAQIILTGGCSHATTNNSQRITLFALLLAALTLGNAYTGQLLGFLAAPPRYKDPQTLTETAGIVRYLHMPIVLPGIFDIEDGPESLRVLNTKIRVSPRTEMDSWVKYIVEHGQDGYVLPDLDCLIYSRMKQMTDDDDVILHMVPECVLSPGHGAFLVKKKSPFFNLLNDFVLRIVGAGLYDYWIHMQLSHMTKEGQLIPEHISKKGPEPLRVEQVTGPFVLLAVGLGVASLIFVVELFGKVNNHS